MHAVSSYPTRIDASETSTLAPGGATLALKLQHKYPDRITGAFTLPAREGRYAPFPADLPPALAEALHARGLSRLYSHQADAWDATQRGEDIVVVTPTASGKTLCYTLPVIAAAIADRSKALYLFPTKRWRRIRSPNCWSSTKRAISACAPRPSMAIRPATSVRRSASTAISS